MSDTFEARLLSAYPATCWPVLVRGFREGLTIADDVRRSTPFLMTLVGRDLRGLLRRAAIMWRLQMLSRTGELPFPADEVENTNGTSHLLSLLSNGIELHVVRTETANAFPDDAPIRQDRRATNTPDLFDDRKIIPLDALLQEVPRLYGWLAWGATAKGELTHLCLAMPEPEQDAWLAHVDILARVSKMAHDARGAREDGQQSSRPDPTLLLKFREEITRSLEDDQARRETGDGGDAV